jgi:hypothetical protein
VNEKLNLEPNAKTEKTISATALDLDRPGADSAIANLIAKEIDAYAERTYNDGHRKHLGASLIGQKCSRALWYVFRWVRRPEHNGRVLRLFNRGHREEDRFVEYLRGIGFKVFTVDLNTDPVYYHPESDSFIKQSQSETDLATDEQLTRIDDETSQLFIKAKAQGVEFKQFRCSEVGGHFGGSLDGIALWPEAWGIPGAILLEFKTNGTGSGFDKLAKSRMAVAKPQHFAQTNVYGSRPQYNFKWCLYLNVNKNDDSLYVELVRLDHSQGQQMIAKAEKIIRSQVPPSRVSEDPNYMDCRYCDFMQECHRSGPFEKNCRSCANAAPVPGGLWFCNLPQHNAVIPDDVIKTGCPQYAQLPND